MQELNNQIYNYLQQVYEEEFDMEMVANAIYFHVNTIEKTDDVDVIETCIECIIELVYNRFSVKYDKIRKTIRKGDGIFGAINKKCIELGVI